MFPFPTEPALLAVTQGYIMQDLIADQVMPRIMVGKKDFKYLKMNKKDRTSVPNTLTGRKSRPSEVDFSATEATGSVKDYALDSGVPQDDVENAYANFNPLHNAVGSLTELIMLDREVRVAGLMSTTANFAGNKTLSGKDQFSNASSNPIGVLNNALESCLQRPNTMVLGTASWLALRTHPAILKAVNRTSGDAGNATKEAVAALFELDEIIVGKAFVNSKNKGQEAEHSRVWGAHISDISIDDTPISNFEEISHQVIAPNQAIRLYEPDYVTAPEVSGQQLFNNKAVGGFIINPADTTTSEIQIDVVAPAGIYNVDGGGNLISRSVNFSVEARTIDNDGVATGNWTTLADETLSGATNTAQRRTYIYKIKKNRWQIRLTRTSEDNTSTRAVDNIHWQAARAKLARKTNTDGVTMLALKMRATNNLSNQNTRKISLIAERKLPVWNGNKWSPPTITRSISWAIADIAKATYGGKLGDGRIDLEALLKLDAVWQGRGDYFDAVFDTKITIWEALNRVARCGRAGCYLQAGILRITRDQAQSMPVAMFTPRNIAKNSLEIDYRLSDDDTATAVTVQFHNKKSWMNDEVTFSIDGNDDEPASISLFGVTDEAHALREAEYLAKANKYRRKVIKFSTELEGLIPSYGDLIKIVHQVSNWGIGGEVTDYDSATRTLTLSETPVWAEATTGYILLRAADGSVQGTWEVDRGNSDNQVVLPDDDDAAPEISIDGNRENTFFGFAIDQHEIGIEARIINIKPKAKNRVEISAITENALVHT